MNPTCTAVVQKRSMSASNGLSMISRQKLDNFRDTNQSHPGCSQRRVMVNITTDIAEPGNAKRTGSGSSANICGFGQRDRNHLVAQSLAGFPRRMSRLLLKWGGDRGVAQATA